jgi:hypothetical protein
MVGNKDFYARSCRLFHLIVDPTFVTLAGVPLLLMDGLPRLSTLRRCLLTAEATAFNTGSMRHTVSEDVVVTLLFLLLLSRAECSRAVT